MKLIIIRGPAGYGKSTYAKKLIEILGTKPEHFEADMFFGEGYEFDFKYLGDAHNWCQAQTAKALFDGKDVIVSNTSIKMKEIKPYYELTLKYGAEFEIFNMTNEYGSIHGVPKKTIQRMKENFKVITTKEYIKHYENTKGGDNV
jgi:adenylate kinase family enzyme